MFINGDFNYPSIIWCTISSFQKSEISFLEEIENHEVHQIVKFNTASTDLIFTSNKSHVTDVHTLDSNDKLGKLSNNYPVEISFNVELSDLMRRKYILEYIFSYCNGDYDFFKEQILENPFYA